MNTRQKALRTGAIFIAVLIVAGLLLLYKGNDAVAIGMEKKEGILTAEQVKMSFDSVSGRLLKEAVKEGDTVKAGDVIMELDSTDTDLSIERTKAQIRSMGGTQAVNYQKADSDEQQSFRQIDQQRAAVSAAQATLKNSQIDYNRKSALLDAGAIAKSQLDDAEMALNVAEANVTQQQQLLDKLLSGARDTGNTDSISLPTIAQQREAAGNMSNDIDALTQQKQALVVQLKQLEVQKERLTLRAPEDGRVIKVLAKEGEMVAAGTPVVLLESDRSYYDIYISEKQAQGLSEGDTITGRTVAGDKSVPGTVRLLTKAPGFADLKQSREKGQADLTAFQVRIYVEPQDGVMPGMTIGVNEREFTKR